MSETINDCGTCTLCCKVLRVDSISKPAGAWCIACDARGGGCGVYENRPQECRDFKCVWLESQSFAPERRLAPSLRPDVSRAVLMAGKDGKALVCHVDPGMPDAPNRAPLRDLLRAVQAGGENVIVVTGRHRLASMNGVLVEYTANEPLEAA